MRAARLPFVVTALFALLLPGCGGSDPAATPTPLPLTPTPLPPTSTPIAFSLPDLVLDYITAPQPVLHDTFETLDEANWTFTPNSVTTSEGEAQMTGVDGWGSHLYRAASVPEGTALVVSFRADTDAEFGIYVESATWNTEEYKRFGAYGPYPETNIFHGTTAEPLQAFDGVLVVQPEVWYELMIAVGAGGEFVALIWDPADPNQHVAYRRVIDQSWTGSDWLFGITANTGFLWIDDFVVVDFDALTS